MAALPPPFPLPSPLPSLAFVECSWKRLSAHQIYDLLEQTTDKKKTIVFTISKTQSLDKTPGCFDDVFKSYSWTLPHLNAYFYFVEKTEVKYKRATNCGGWWHVSNKLWRLMACQVGLGKRATFAVREVSVSRHNGSLIMALPNTSHYDSTLCEIRGAPMRPRDVSLSDSCTSDRCCFSLSFRTGIFYIDRQRGSRLVRIWSNSGHLKPLSTVL